MYIRLGSTNRQADLPLIRELERIATNRVFDQLPVPEQSLDDLDVPALEQMLGRPLNVEELRTLGVAGPDSEGRVVPTNGGILLAGHRREE